MIKLLNKLILMLIVIMPMAILIQQHTIYCETLEEISPESLVTIKEVLKEHLIVIAKSNPVQELLQRSASFNLLLKYTGYIEKFVEALPLAELLVEHQYNIIELTQSITDDFCKDILLKKHKLEQRIIISCQVVTWPIIVCIDVVKSYYAFQEIAVVLAIPKARQVQVPQIEGTTFEHQVLVELGQIASKNHLGIGLSFDDTNCIIIYYDGIQILIPLYLFY